MKSYYQFTKSNTLEKDFIKKYSIENEMIVIYPGEGSAYSIPYTKEKEQELLKKMESQIKELSLFEKNINYSINIVRRKLEIIVGFWILSLLTLFVPTSDIISSLFLITVSSLLLGGSVAYIMHEESLKHDIEKAKSFQKKHQELQIDDYMLIHNKSKTISKELSQTKPHIDINNIDNLTLRELKRFKSLIEEEKKEDIVNDNSTKVYVKSSPK